MNDLRLPMKIKARYPHRRTLCVSSKVEKVLVLLEQNGNIDTPELLRKSVEEYFEKHNLYDILKNPESINNANEF